MKNTNRTVFAFITTVLLFLLLSAFPTTIYAANETELPITGPRSMRIFMADTQTPQVVGRTESTITELPKTGVPLALWGLTALAPIGYKLKNLRKEKVSNVSPTDLWITRELQK